MNQNWSSERIARSATPLTRVLATIHGNLNSAGFNPREILRAIDRLIEGKLWVDEVDDEGQPMTLRRALTAPWPTGVGMDDGEIERILEIARDRGLDDELIMRVGKAITPAAPRQGRPHKGTNDTFMEGSKTSRHNKLRRIRRKDPRMAARVDAGEISATAAAIALGIEKAKVEVPLGDAVAAVRLLTKPKRYTVEELRKALEGIP